MKRPKPIAVGKVRVRVHSGPREDGAWRWRADRADGMKDGREVRVAVWSGWATEDEVAQKVIDVLADRGEVWRSPEDVRTVGDLLSVWTADVERGDRSGYTTRARDGSANRLSEAPIASVRLDRVDHRVLDAFVRSYPGAASTLRSDLISLRAAWNWGRSRELVPDRDLPRVRVRAGAPVTSRYTPTAEEVAAVLERLRLRVTRPPLWPWRATYLLWATGCRPGEIASLTWDRVDLAKRLIRVTGKTGPRAVPLHPTVAAELGTWERHGPTVAGCAPESVKGHLHVKIEAACADVGCERWSLYGLRRAAVARLYRAGVDPSVAAAVLGHSPQTALKHYRQVAESDLAEAVRITGLGLLPEVPANNVIPLRRDEEG